jgi:hypothetical protein
MTEKKRIDAFLETPVVINGRNMIQRTPIECYEIIDVPDKKEENEKK